MRDERVGRVDGHGVVVVQLHAGLAAAGSVGVASTWVGALAWVDDHGVVLMQHIAAPAFKGVFYARPRI